MLKCSMLNPEPNNKTLPTRLSPVEEQQKEAQYSWTLQGKDCEMEKIMRFLMEMMKFEDI